MKVSVLSAFQTKSHTSRIGSYLGLEKCTSLITGFCLKPHASKFILYGFLLLTYGVSAQTVTQSFTTPGSFNFTVPPQVTELTVQAWGGGGGGRGDGTQSTGGGGGGAYASGVITVTPGQVIPLVVGTGGVATSNPGQSGQASVFGSNQIVAAGGTGGTNSGGPGGTVANSIGSTRFAGGAGGNRDQSLLGITSGSGGGGGGSASTTANGSNGSNGNGNTGGNGGNGTGNGGRGGDNLGNGSNGIAPGGGGGGKGSEGILTQTVAGRGATGRIVISWVSPNTDLRLAMTGSSTQTTIGKPVTFTLTVTNDGPNQAFGTVVNAALPAGITFVSASTSVGTYSKTTGIWSIGAMNNGQSVTMTIQGVLNTTNSYQYSATVTAIQPDNNLGNNTASSTPNICKAGDVSPAFF